MFIIRTHRHVVINYSMKSDIFINSPGNAFENMQCQSDRSDLASKISFTFLASGGRWRERGKKGLSNKIFSQCIFIWTFLCFFLLIKEFILFNRKRPCVVSPTVCYSLTAFYLYKWWNKDNKVAYNKKKDIIKGVLSFILLQERRHSPGSVEMISKARKGWC